MKYLGIDKEQMEIMNKIAEKKVKEYLPNIVEYFVVYIVGAVEDNKELCILKKV